MPSVCSPKRVCSPSAFASSDRYLVWTNKKKQTSGGLTKGDLKLNGQGKIVSASKSKSAKKNLSPHFFKKGGRKSPAKGKRSRSPPREGTRKSPRNK